jgi:membrane protein
VIAALEELGIILKETVIEWVEDGVPERGAALSYYVLLSLGPVLVIIVGVLELVMTGDNVRGQVVDVLQTHVGARAAETARLVLQRADVPDLLAPESILTIALLLFGATAAFSNIRGSLNKIWGVEEQDRSKREVVLDFLKGRARGFLMIALTGLVILLSFIVSSVVGVLSNVLEGGLPYGGFLVRGLDILVSVLFTGFLFGALYRTLPSTRIRWSTVWVGAFATALLFVIGKSLVAWLIASAAWTSYYGPGASVVAFLAWIYFSAQIFYLGAEFTQVWSRRRGGVMSRHP